MNRRNDEFTIFGMLLLMTLTGLFWSCRMGADEQKAETTAAAIPEKPWHIYILGSNMGEKKNDTDRTVRAVVGYLSRSTSLLTNHSVRVIEKRDANSLEEARNHAEEALNDPKHLLTIGHDYSSMAYPIALLYAEVGKLFFTTTATSTQIGEIEGTVFQLCADNQSQAKALVHFAINKLAGKNKKIMILENKIDLYSINLTVLIKEELDRPEYGCPEVVTHQYNLRQFESEPLEEKLHAEQPGLIILPDAGQNAASIVLRLNQIGGPVPPILGSDGWGSDKDVVTRFHSAIEQKPDNGYYYVYPWHQGLSKGDAAMASAGSAFAYQGLEVLDKVIAGFEQDVLVDQKDLADALRNYKERWGLVTLNDLEYYARFDGKKVIRPWFLLELEPGQKFLTSQAARRGIWPTRFML